MAVVGFAKPIGPGRSGDDLEDGLKRFTRTYIVHTNSVYDGPNVVLGATGLPSLADPYDGHPSAICIGRFPNPLPGTRLVWLVECEWSTHSVDRDENPLNTKPEIEWGYEPFDEVLAGSAMPDRDPLEPDPTTGYVAGGQPGTSSAGQMFGRGIVNSAGDPFDPPPVNPNYLPVVRFTRNEPTFLAQNALKFGNTVNKVAWNGLLPRQAWLKPIEATNQVQHAAGIDQADILYWRVRYTFVLKGNTWDLHLLNIGPNYLTVANTNPQAVKKRFYTTDGTPTHGLLKADGTRYAPGTENIATYRHHRVKLEVDFVPLNINLNLALNQIRKKRR